MRSGNQSTLSYYLIYRKDLSGHNHFIGWQDIFSEVYANFSASSVESCRNTAFAICLPHWKGYLAPSASLFYQIFQKIKLEFLKMHKIYTSNKDEQFQDMQPAKQLKIRLGVNNMYIYMTYQKEVCKALWGDSKHFVLREIAAEMLSLNRGRNRFKSISKYAE